MTTENNAALRKIIEEAKDSLGFRDLVLESFGVRPEVQDFIREKCPDFSVGAIPGYGGGWYPPATLDGKGKIVLASYQPEACLHECAHVWWHWHRIEDKNDAYKLAFQTATFAIVDPDMVGMGDFDEFHDFARGYYFGVGDWPGMYVTNGKKATLQKPGRMDWLFHPCRKYLDMDLVIDWEIFAGICSWSMGQVNSGNRQLPAPMRYLFSQFFTGQIKATPYYEGGL